MWCKLWFSPPVFSGVLKRYPFQSCPEEQPTNKRKTILTEVNRIHTWKYDLERNEMKFYTHFLSHWDAKGQIIMMKNTY